MLKLVLYLRRKKKVVRTKWYEITFSLPHISGSNTYFSHCALLWVEMFMLGAHTMLKMSKYE